MEYRVRAYRPEDCAEMARLFYETVHTVNAGDYTEGQLEAWAPEIPETESWNRSFLEHFTFVAEKQGRIVGFGDIDGTGYLDRLYVHREEQGKGIAAALCRRLEAMCPGKTVTVYASITARPFFEKRGYRTSKEQIVVRNGTELNNYVMKKMLRTGSRDELLSERSE